MEIHVPQSFTAERPAVSYSQEALAVNIDSHELAKTLPKVTDGASIQPGPADFRAFAAREGAPETLDDFIYHDIPQLSLHITLFNDATLVALSWPHTLMDVMGQQALLRGWSMVLAGRESEVPPVLGAKEDAIRAAGDTPVETKEDFKLGQKQMKGIGLFMFGLRFAWDMIRNPVVETRIVFLPKKALAELRRQAEGDLGEKDFVSDGDLLTAWAARAVASSLPQPRPVTVLHAMNARFRLSSLLNAPGVYIQNMAVAAFAFLPADTATRPLGQTALDNRRHSMEQATEGQVLAFLRELQKDAKGGDPRLLCGESDALLLPFTNWDRADVFRAADFSPAVVRAGETKPSRVNPPGTIVYHHAHSMRPNGSARNVVVVLGKDHGGNHWLTGILLPSTWAKIEEEIKKL